MCNRKRVIMIMTVVGMLGATVVNAATGESIGANINSAEYKISSKTPIVAKYGKSKSSTTCGSYSKSDSVQSVIWYSKNNQSPRMGQCLSKYIVSTVYKGKKLDRVVSLPSQTTFYTIGIYAGICVSKTDASEGEGTGSTLTTNCN